MGGKDPERGLLAALAQLCCESSLHNLQVVVFGQLAPQTPPQLGSLVH